MTTHTDRIRQMAQEAGFPERVAYIHEGTLARFAQLVAEDCARVVREQRMPIGSEACDTRDELSDAIRARYNPNT